jgi:4-amino-4-deoxy-L-arabinose transferase-like glycosyltransferase
LGVNDPLSPPAAGRNRTSIHVLLLALLAAGLFFVNLGGPALWEKDEPYYAEGAREMLVSGDYLVPQFNFEPRLNKPILHYWFILLSYRLFGVGEFSARFSTACFATLLVLVTYWLGARLFERRSAFVSAALLATSYGFVTWGRRAYTDITLAAFITAALAFFWVGIEGEGKRHCLWAGYAAMALAFMTKGPVGVLLPVLIISIYLGVTRSLSRWRKLEIPVGLLIFLALVLPWYLYIIAARGVSVLVDSGSREVLSRFFTGSFSHGKSLLFYPQVLAGDAAPWIVFLPSAFWWWLKRRKGADGREKKSFSFLLISVLVIFTFFMLGRFKASHYLLPILPPLFLLLGKPVAELGRAGGKSARLFSVPAAVLGALFFAGGIVCILEMKVLTIPETLFFPLWLIPATLFLASIVLVFLLVRGKRGVVLSALVVCAALVYMETALDGAVLFEQYRPLKPMAGTIARVAAPGDAVVCFGGLKTSLVFYLERPVGVVRTAGELEQYLEDKGDRRVFLVIEEGDFLRLPATLRSAGEVLESRPQYLPKLRTLLRNPEEKRGRHLLLVRFGSQARLKNPPGFS